MSDVFDPFNLDEEEPTNRGRLQPSDHTVQPQDGDNKNQQNDPVNRNLGEVSKSNHGKKRNKNSKIKNKVRSRSATSMASYSNHAFMASPNTASNNGVTSLDTDIFSVLFQNPSDASNVKSGNDEVSLATPIKSNMRRGESQNKHRSDSWTPAKSNMSKRTFGVRSDNSTIVDALPFNRHDSDFTKFVKSIEGTVPLGRGDSFFEEQKDPAPLKSPGAFNSTRNKTVEDVYNKESSFHSDMDNIAIADVNKNNFKVKSPDTVAGTNHDTSPLKVQGIKLFSKDSDCDSDDGEDNNKSKDEDVAFQSIPFNCTETPVKARSQHDVSMDHESSQFVEVPFSSHDSFIKNSGEEYTSEKTHLGLRKDHDRSYANRVGRQIETVRIPITLSLHEQLNCIYDGAPNSTPTMEVTGAIGIKSITEEIQGKTVYISMEDGCDHIKEIQCDTRIAKEMSEEEGKVSISAFVNKQKKKGCRVFQVEVPQVPQDMNDQPLNLVTYTGSQFCRPIPLLVNVKVRAAGQFCRVGVKIRSNPITGQTIQNLVVLMAIPPDINGESMKISRRGGVWDPMKRVIIYKYDHIESGETVEVQMQFDYSSPLEGGLSSGDDNSSLPRFPVLVRCDGVHGQLSTVDICVGGSDFDDDKKNVIYKLNLAKSYKVFHRKI